MRALVARHRTRAGALLWTELLASVPLLYFAPGGPLPWLLAFLVLLLIWPFLAATLTRNRVVRSRGDRWRVGRYSEAALRSLVREALERCAAPGIRVRLFVREERGVHAFTQFLFPGARRPLMISLTSGALHYLEPGEIQAVLLHEIAHHRRECRVIGWASLTACDLLAVALTAGITHVTGLSFALALFLPIRLVLLRLTLATADPANHAVEHLCDGYSAAHLGPLPLANALLKIGEEGELAEAVIARAVRILRRHHDPGDLEEIVETFIETRPHGRIFHESLERHAAEIVETLEPSNAHVGVDPNPALQSFLEERRRRRRARIRWRRFDAEGKGQLSREELGELCSTLRDHPERTLFLSEDELEPTTHPPMRERILLLWPGPCLRS